MRAERATAPQAQCTGSALAEFFAAMAAAGIEPHDDLQLIEGTLIRFRERRDKSGRKNAWAVFHSRPVPAGAFGYWGTGESHTWRMRPPINETAGQRNERRRQLEAMRVSRQAEEDRLRQAARERAARLWRTARPATNAHAYLQAKGVHAYGIRQLRDTLVIPARDVQGVLHTLQFIGVDGTKRFLTGGRIEACYCSLGQLRDRLYLAEGYASAATVHHATGEAVAACFSCGNLKAVAVALRAKFPDLAMVIAADNDAATPGNPGVTYAFEAAAAAGALVAVPDFAGFKP